MSLVALLPYFRARCDAAQLQEWPEPFDVSNIPSTLIDRAYHLEFSGGNGVASENVTVELNTRTTVRFFLKGYRDVAAARDAALALAESLIGACCSSNNWAGTELKGVFLDSVSIEPFEVEENDNVVVGVIVFEARTFVCLD